MTCRLRGTPAPAEVGAESTNWVAAPGRTRIDAVPAIVGATVSVAPTDRLPAVFSVARKLCCPASAAVKV
ncbi:MAG: hypothetical protein E6H92_14840 [Chloroflexi bacterium]|nr:MAG: hypothetical protein E6H92_14840 [Chloroflexota bacterium]